MRTFALLVLLSLLLPGSAFSAPSKFTLASPAFKDGELIPSVHTCDGKNESPALYWENRPKGTQSFVLIVEDKDAPIGIWNHWIVYNINPVISGLPGKLPPADQLVNGELQGRNDFQVLGYGGPCPPSGTHRYYFRLYALDDPRAWDQRLRKSEILKKMKGHILGEAVLMGRYERQKKEAS